MQAGAAEKDIPLYKHIAELAGNTKLVRPELAAVAPQGLHNTHATSAPACGLQC